MGAGANANAGARGPLKMHQNPAFDGVTIYLRVWVEILCDILYVFVCVYVHVHEYPCIYYTHVYICMCLHEHTRKRA